MKNAMNERFKDWLSNIYPPKEISKSNFSMSAPCLLLKYSQDLQMIEITSFDADSGKHYSGWYFMPITFQAFQQRLSFNEMELQKLLLTIPKIHK